MKGPIIHSYHRRSCCGSSDFERDVILSVSNTTFLFCLILSQTIHPLHKTQSVHCFLFIFYKLHPTELSSVHVEFSAFSSLQVAVLIKLN